MASERRSPGWLRYSGVGLELAGATAGLALVGYWIDGRFGTRPWGMIAGVVIGLVGGLYNLVRESLEAVREAKADDDENARGRVASKEQPGEGGD
jgi:ATP synthase protein I